jgi:phospholipase C
MSRHRFSHPAGATLVALAGLACNPPPDAIVGLPPSGGADASTALDAGDPFAAKRAACTFGAGARATETLPISASEQAAIPITHVVVVMKENRSFDHLLGNLAAEGQPDAEAIPASFTNQDDSGAAVAPFHLPTTCVNMDPGHQWDEMHRQVNGGKMDGFVTNGADTTGGDGHFVMGTYEARDVPFYYWLANTFAINDHHFASARSGTWPDRNFLMLGTADGVRCTYCGLPDPSTRSIFDALDAVGVSWGAYTDGDPFDGTLGWTKDHAGVHSFADFKAALAAGTLPHVSFVDGIGWLEDEHPTADVQVGEAWTRTVYEAAVASPLWPNLAMIWTYDEGGGFADHVPPPNQACIARPGNPRDTPFFELGVRVPLAMISPYVRPHYVSHVVQDHTAITRFIEVVFGLPALTARDANSDGLLDMLNFNCLPPLLHPPEAPAAGVGGCNGVVVLSTDMESYTSSVDMAVKVSFSGVTAPAAHDRIGVYHYADVPTEVNGLDPVAWAYIGGQGHVAQGAPSSGVVTIDKTTPSTGAAWPLPSGLWIAYYLPALPSGQDGHTPLASADFEVGP